MANASHVAIAAAANALDKLAHVEAAIPYFMESTMAVRILWPLHINLGLKRDCLGQ
jgi:hypothetical protein